MSNANCSSKPRLPFLDKTRQVIVNFNYVYTHKSKKIEITKGERLQLLQKTNEHWWKCLRLGQPKSFYVPATYVSVLEPQHSDSASTDDDLENDDETQCDIKNDKLSPGMKMRHPMKENGMKEEDNQSLSSIPSNVVTFSNEQLASGSFSNNHSSSVNSSSVHIDKASSCGSISNLKKTPYWSTSLEELAKQIVFPGQSTIYFNNPSFKPDSSSSFKIDSTSLNQRTPPPSLSLSSDLDNDSNDPNSSNEGNTSGPQGLTDEEIEPPRKQDLIRALTNNWAEYKCRNSDRIFYYNALTKSRSWKPPRLSKEESNNNVFQIPTGWAQSVDELNGTVSFINQATGSKWFSSTDPQGKIYFYEENSSKSSWFLPVTDNAGQTSAGARPTSCLPTKHHESISSGDASEIEELAKPQKRHSTGDRDYVSERLLKTTSAFLTDSRFSNLDNKGTLPRSIWKHGKPSIIHENLLSRTKYLENNKKVRKNWTTSWAVLTESHLSFFKDQKCLNAQNIKSELEVDLHYSRIEANNEKSSRKNVFQITCSHLGLELLCQTPNPADSAVWSGKIREVIDSLVQPDDIYKFKGKTDYLEVCSGENTVKRRSTMKSSTKVKITSPEEDDKNKIRAQLKKFFNRRPPRDSLVKKGIYKDEPVFGCLLEKLAQNDRSPIPRFVDECINVIESKEENLKTDGIYRASGNLSQVQKIRLQVDQDNLSILHSEDDVHVLAGALKLFFREMREPIIPSNLFDRFLNACHMPHREDKVKEFQSLIKALPKPNYATLKRLLSHLLKVSDYSEFNRMQIPNLAIVFGPTLMWNNIESANMAIDLMQQNYVVEILLSDFDSLFS